MIKIHIYSHGETRGPFDIDEVNLLLRVKKFSLSDHGCIPGGKKWQRLDSEFFSELGVSVNEQEEPQREKEDVSTSEKNVRNPGISKSLESAAGIAGSFFKKAKSKLKSENLSGKLDGFVDKVKFLPKNIVSGEMIRVQ